MMSKTGGSSSSSSGGSDSSIWVKCVDEKEGRLYWYNTLTGASLWTSPDDNNELVVEERDRIAVIVPFRDLHAQQQRLQQLKQFIPEMTKFLLQGEVPFKLYIIEQSNDGRKFNRGKLLNVGFLLAVQDRATVFIFHDVDLLPSRDLLPFYTKVPTNGPVHIAKRWDRYNKNNRYFGGIAVFSQEGYERINGYPNNYWGWGGEDDELRNRIEATGTVISSEPRVGQIYDMEQKGLEEKLAELRAQPEIKCMHKKELLTEHEATWRSNGLTSFAREEHYKVIKAESLTPYALKVTVDLSLNGHWTDQKCVE